MADDLNKGVPHDEWWRFVQVADPALVKAWHEAREAYNQNEPAYQEKLTGYRMSSGKVRTPVESPLGKALREAEAPVIGKYEELYASGRVVDAGYPDGKLDGDPKVIPLAVLGKRRPRGARFSVRGVTFHDVRLYPAEVFRAPGRPQEPGAPRGKRKTPRDAKDRLKIWVADCDAPEKSHPEVAAEVAASHPEVLHKDSNDVLANPSGWWAWGTLCDYVGEIRPVKR